MPDRKNMFKAKKDEINALFSGEFWNSGINTISDEVECLLNIPKISKMVITIETYTNVKFIITENVFFVRLTNNRKIKPAFEILLYAKRRLKVNCWKPKTVEVMIPKKVIKIKKKMLISSIVMLLKILINGIIKNNFVRVVKNVKRVPAEAW